MRAGADNFDLPEIAEAAALAHAMGKKVYVTVNTMPRTHEYEALEAYIKSLAPLGFRRADCSRPRCFLHCAVPAAPETPLHISTQAGVVSAADCLFWASQGAKRVVLARELSLQDIKQIRSLVPDSLELEAFIHGSMCVSYSGRCLLSENILGRDAQPRAVRTALPLEL